MLVWLNEAYKDYDKLKQQPFGPWSPPKIFCKMTHTNSTSYITAAFTFFFFFFNHSKQPTTPTIVTHMGGFSYRKTLSFINPALGRKVHFVLLLPLSLASLTGTLPSYITSLHSHAVLAFNNIPDQAEAVPLPILSLSLRGIRTEVYH